MHSFDDIRAALDDLEVSIETRIDDMERERDTAYAAVENVANAFDTIRLDLASRYGHAPLPDLIAIDRLYRSDLQAAIRDLRMEAAP